MFFAIKLYPNSYLLLQSNLLLISSNLVDVGSQNYSGSDASYQQTQSVKPDPYQQQGAYYDSSQQFGGASNKGTIDLTCFSTL